MKRSRQVILTMMGSAAIGTVSMGFVGRRGCPPGLVLQVVPGPDGRPVGYCQPVYYGGVAYGGFGGTTRRFQFHGGGG